LRRIFDAVVIVNGEMFGLDRPPAVEGMERSGEKRTRDQKQKKNFPHLVENT